MILTAAARTDVGLRRSANEDCFALASKLGLYLVADGMGGHTAGQLASRLATAETREAMQRVAEADATLTEKLRYCVAAANRQVFDTAQNKPELAGMGTHPEAGRSTSPCHSPSPGRHRRKDPDLRHCPGRKKPRWSTRRQPLLQLAE